MTVDRSAGDSQRPAATTADCNAAERPAATSANRSAGERPVATSADRSTGERRAATSAARSAEPAGRAAWRAAGARLAALGVLVVCVGVLSVAAWLRPDARGYGTHEQFARGPCGFLVTTGLPCITCGMTTSFAYTVRGRVLAAVRTQPAGFVLATATAAVAVVAAWTLLAGRWPNLGLHRVSPWVLYGGLLALLLGAWGYKVAMGLADGSLPYR